jgi:phosphate transport system permease protein
VTVLSNGSTAHRTEALRDPADVVVDLRDRLPADVPGEDVPREIRSRTLDDVAATVGSALASLAAVWLVYDRLLGLDGVLGFLVCWFLADLAVYVAVSFRYHPRVVIVDRVVAAVIQVMTAVAGVALLSTIVFVFVNGWPALHHLNFFTHDMSGVRPTAPLTQGGVLHAIVGTVITIGIASAIALPLGVGTAVFMTEVGGRLADAVRSTVDAMTAMPDILAGLFVYALLIIAFGWEKDGFAVSIALAVTMVPVIARSAEVVLRIVPGGLREAGLALGSSSWSTVRHVVLPTARMGIASSLILGIARVTGETAPLLIVSGATTFLNVNPFHEPMNSLPLFIFTAIRSGEPNYIKRGYGAAALLLALVLVLFVLARVVGRGRKATR